MRLLAPLKKAAQILNDAPPSTEGRPTRLFLGYHPDISEGEARGIIHSIASKHAIATDIAYAGVRRMGSGWAYELHEGGSGKGWLPTLCALKDKLGSDTTPDHPESVYINTVERTHQVELDYYGGLKFVTLPESERYKDTPNLFPTWPLERLTPENSTKFLQATSILLFASLVAFVFATIKDVALVTALPALVKPSEPAEMPSALWQRHADTADGNATLRVIGGAARVTATDAVENRGLSLTEEASTKGTDTAVPSTGTTGPSGAALHAASPDPLPVPKADGNAEQVTQPTPAPQAGTSAAQPEAPATPTVALEAIPNKPAEPPAGTDLPGSKETPK